MFSQGKKMAGLKPFRHYRRHKYNARSQVCSQGHRHDSMGEAGYCDTLALLKSVGDIKSYETQVTFPLKVKGKTITTHRVDFVVVGKDGRKAVHECKGFSTREWGLKKKLFEVCYPGIEYFVVQI